MRRSIVISLFAILVLVFVQSVSASWYTGNRRSDTYGAKANIWAPSSAPYINIGGESNWVSLPSPGWVQAGWRYYKGWSSAMRYVEYSTSSGAYGLYHHGTHSWGGIVEYKIDHIGSTTWCAYIAGVNKLCAQVRPAPSQVKAYSEVHDSSDNGLDTRFSAVYYRTSGGSWNTFDQGNWREDTPYRVQKDQYYYFRNYRP